MKTITVRKEVLINLGNFSNIKIGIEITTDKGFEDAWLELNQELEKQELYERGLRLQPQRPKDDSKSDFKAF
jgi:hypothetical protein